MSRKTKIWLVVLVVLVVVGVVMYVLLQNWMNSDNAGNVYVGQPKTNSSDKTPDSVAIKSDYFTATLPGGFVIKRSGADPSGSSLFQVTADTPSTTDESIAASISTTPPGGIQEVGDYHLRASQTDTYAPFTPPNLPPSAKAFKNVSGPAGFVVFWPHANHFAEISLSTDGVASLDQLQTVFSQIVASWQWL